MSTSYVVWIAGANKRVKKETFNLRKHMGRKDFTRERDDIAAPVVTGCVNQGFQSACSRTGLQSWRCAQDLQRGLWSSHLAIILCMLQAHITASLAVYELQLGVTLLTQDTDASWFYWGCSCSSMAVVTEEGAACVQTLWEKATYILTNLLWQSFRILWHPIPINTIFTTVFNPSLPLPTPTLTLPHTTQKTKPFKPLASPLPPLSKAPKLFTTVWSPLRYLPSSIPLHHPQQTPDLWNLHQPS